jgi:hypothetical protein
MTGPDSLSKSFGLSIAFLIPGAVALYAASFFLPVVSQWFGAASNGPTITVGGFLFVILGSAGMGVFVSGIRWMVIDWLVCQKMKLQWLPEPPPGIDQARRKNHDCEAAYQDLRFSHYQFAQFYLNMPFALALAYLAWLIRGQWTGEQVFWLAIGMAVADVVLLMSGKHALERYKEKVTGLFSPTDATA